MTSPRTTHAVFAIAVAAALAGALAGCDDLPGPPPPDSGRRAKLAEGDVVVAEVDGVPIGAARVAEVAKATGHTPREVVERLVEFELLAAEARRRGLEDHYDVRYVARQAMVQRYLEQEFEATHRVSDVPESLTRSAYQQVRAHYVHPKLYKIAHIHVWAVEGEASPSKRRQAQALATEIAREARGVKSLEEFFDVGRRYQGRDGFKVQYAEVDGAVHERSRHQKSIWEVVSKLDAGQVGGPAQTTYGSHVLYVIDTKEASNRSFDDVRDEVREGIHPIWIRQEFMKLADRLRLRTKVEGYVGPKRRTGGS